MEQNKRVGVASQREIQLLHMIVEKNIYSKPSRFQLELFAPKPASILLKKNNDVTSTFIDCNVTSSDTLCTAATGYVKLFIKTLIFHACSFPRRVLKRVKREPHTCYPNRVNMMAHAWWKVSAQWFMQIVAHACEPKLLLQMLSLPLLALSFIDDF